MWPEKPLASAMKKKKNGKDKEKNDSRSCDNSDEEKDEDDGPENINMEAKNSNPKNNGASTTATVGQVVKFHGVDSSVTVDHQQVKTDGKPPGNANGAVPAVGQAGKKKKKKGRKSNNNNQNNSNAGGGVAAPAVVHSSTGMENHNMGPIQVVQEQTNLSRSFQNLYQPYPYSPQLQAQVMSYNAAYNNSSAVPIYSYMPPPYMYAYARSPDPEAYNYNSENPSSALSTFEILSDENPNGCHVM